MAHDLVTELLQYSSLACFMPIWQLCANLLIPNCLRFNLSYSPLAALELYVNPTYSDNFPTTNIEALACGTPIVTYNTGGSPEAIDDKTGIVVEQGDVSSLIKAIMDISKNPPLQYDCRTRAKNLFDKDQQFKKYINLYNEVLKQV